MSPAPQPFRVRELGLDLPAVAGSFSRRLHDAGVPVTAERAAWFAQALAVVEPISRRRLYWTARAAFVSDRTQVPAFDRVFAIVFGSAPPRPDGPGGRDRAGGVRIQWGAATHDQWCTTRRRRPIRHGEH